MKAIIILLLSVSMYGQVSSGGAHAERKVSGLMLDAGRATRWRDLENPTNAETVRQSDPLERTLQVAMVASAAFDSYTTVRNVSNGCTERNPLMGRRPSAARVAVFEAGWTAGELVIAHFLHRHHPKIAAVLLGESLIEHGVAGGLNTQQKCF